MDLDAPEQAAEPFDPWPKVQRTKEQAERALEEGRTVFVARTSRTTFQRLGENIAGDGEVARLVEAVESVG